MKTLVLGTEDNAIHYMKVGEDWVSKTNGLFASAYRTAAFAVAEYAANQDGVTLYPTLIGKEAK